MDKKDESFDIDWKMEGFWETTGEIPYTATNDFMFHMLMQENMEILRSVLSAVLRVEEDIISDIEVSNPINRGSCIDFLLLNAVAVFDVDFNRMVDFHKQHGGLVTLFTH